MATPYTVAGSPPRTLNSIVCYADILGYSELVREAIDAGKGDAFLGRLRVALTSVYEKMRAQAKLLDDDPGEQFGLKVFTDNIVVGIPLGDHESVGEPELGWMLSLFSDLQASLAADGFLIRGGIAYGPHYMDDDIVFGSALLDAVKLDAPGGAPRLVLHENVRELIRHHATWYGGILRSMPHYSALRQDADGKIFVNYLDESVADFPDSGVNIEVIAAHRGTLESGLTLYRGNPDVRAKYEWGARYHNAFCRSFAGEHKPSGDDRDPESENACESAQGLLDYVIDVEQFAPFPQNIHQI